MKAPYKFTLLVLAVAFAGCASTSPPSPTLTTVLPAQYSGSTGETSNANLEENWWASFGDKDLNSLIDQALIANQDVAIAVARVRAAKAGTNAQSSRLLPNVGLQASASTSESGLPEAVKQAGQPDTRAYRAGIDFAWEMDLAGGVRAARSAASSDAQAAEAGVTGVRLLVASEVARQYFLLRGGEQKLRIVKSLAMAQRETARLTSNRALEGQASHFELLRAEAEADALEAQVPQLRTLTGSIQNRIAVLIGVAPSLPQKSEQQDYVWPLPKAIGTGQPSELLRRRPDLLAAEHRYGAEVLRGDEARAQLWPKIFLSALIGSEGLRLNALDLAPVRFSTAALTFSMPLFNRDRVLAGIEAQSARADEAMLNWQKSVLTAVEEVENSLLLRDQEIQRGRSLKSAVLAQRQSLAHAQSLRYEGQIDQLVLLDVQRALLAAELSLTDSTSQQALNDVQLYKALGGGWSASNSSASQTSLLQLSQIVGSNQ